MEERPFARERLLNSSLYGREIRTAPAEPSGLRGGLQEGVQFLLGFVLLEAVVLLEAAQERVLLASNVLEVVVCQLRPLAPKLALQLFPVSFDGVPVHLSLLGAKPRIDSRRASSQSA